MLLFFSRHFERTKAKIYNKREEKIEEILKKKCSHPALKEKVADKRERLRKDNEEREKRGRQKPRTWKIGS